MRPPRRDSINRGINTPKIYWLILAAALVFLCACTNDIEHIKALTNQLNLPNQSAKNIELQYNDSSRLQMILKAPEMERFARPEEQPYREFPKGIEVLFFDKKEKLKSRITAKYAKYFENEQLWVARDSVVARNVQTNEELTTEELFWDMAKKTIYSHVFTKIVNSDGVYYGEKGFESDQNFDNYKLIGSSGTVNVKDEQQN